MEPIENEPVIPSRQSRIEKYSNRWLTVFEDEVRFSDEHSGPYGIIEKPDFSLVIPIRAGLFGLINQYRYPIAQWRLEFPQGALHGAEEAASPDDVARQELREETGLLSDQVISLGVFHESYGLSACACHVFMATVTESIQAEPERTELILDLVWVTPTKFWNLVSLGEITDAATIAAMGIYQAQHA